MPLPRPQPRPAFALWRYERNLTLRATADLLETHTGKRICSHETVRLICLPFGDPDRLAPDTELQAAIFTLSEGLIDTPSWSLVTERAA